MGSTVSVVQKAFDVLEHLARYGDAGVSQLSRELHIPLATVHRLLATLSVSGYVLKDPASQNYRLSTKVLQLSGSVLSRLNVRTIALPHMRRLAVDFRETVNLGVLEGDRVVYADTIPTPEPLRFEVPLGGYFAAHCTGLGKAIAAHIPAAQLRRLLGDGRLPRFTPNTIVERSVLLRHLTEARARGYVLDDEEMHEGIRSVGAPVRDRHGRVVAAISMAAPTLRMPDTRVAAVATAIVKAAAEISAELGAVSNHNRLHEGNANGE